MKISRVRAKASEGPLRNMAQGALASDKRINSNKTLPVFVASFFFFLRGLHLVVWSRVNYSRSAWIEDWNREIFGTARISYLRRCVLWQGVKLKWQPSNLTKIRSQISVWILLYLLGRQELHFFPQVTFLLPVVRWSSTSVTPNRQKDSTMKALTYRLVTSYIAIVAWSDVVPRINIYE